MGERRAPLRKKGGESFFFAFFLGKRGARQEIKSFSLPPLSISPSHPLSKICSAKNSPRPQATTQHRGASLWQKKTNRKKAKISAAQLSLSPTTEFEKCIFYFLSSKKGRQKASPDGMTVDVDVCHVCPIPFLVGWRVGKSPCVKTKIRCHERQPSLFHLYFGRSDT